MADRSIQQRSMRKAVERVDIGIFAVPMKVVALRGRLKSTWGGFIALLAGHAVAAVVIALVLGLVLHVPVNPLSMSVFAAFVVGCVIGGPISFTIWSFLLIGLTGVLGGMTLGAWISSPSWWRELAAAWNAGKSVPGWFMVAVPTWILFWVATSFMVSRALEVISGRITLRTAFRAASRFLTEEERIRAEAFAESDVSAAESRAILDGGDGTTTVVAINPPIVEQGIRIAKPSDLGEERMSSLGSTAPALSPSASGADYSMLEQNMSDPLIRRAAGFGSEAVEEEAEILPGIPTTDVAVTKPVSVQMGSSVPTIPAPEQKAPARAMPSPQIDTLGNRAMVRRLTQLVLAFNTAEHEGATDQFILDNEDELAQMSDEQMRLMGTIAEAGPLVAFAKSIKDARLGAFMLGRADPPVPAGTGSLAGSDASASDSAASSSDTSGSADAAGDAIAPNGRDVDEDDGEDDGSVIAPGSIASMATSLVALMRPQPGARGTVPSNGPIAGDASDAASEDAEMDAGDDAAHATMADAAPHQPSGDASVDVTVSEGGQEGSPEERLIVPGVVSALDGDGNKQDFFVDIKSDQKSETDHVPQKDVTGDNAGDDLVASAAADAMSHGDVSAGGGVDQGDDDGAEVLEDDMSALVFTRLVCRQVLGLVIGTSDAAVKAGDVLDFERANPGILVSQVINSRSFDEHVGSDVAVSSRHSWIEVQKMLSQSNVDRLVSDFERVNARGRQMLEEPHTLTQAAFNLFDRESVKLRQAVGVNDETMSRAMPLYRENAVTHDALQRILTQRAEAPAVVQKNPGLPRQRLGVGEDIREVARGKSMVSSLLSGTRDAGLSAVLVDSDSAPVVVPPVAADVVSPSSPAEPADRAQDSHAEDTMPVADPTSAKTPEPGDEDFVSSHPEGSPDYIFEMETHEALLPVHRRRREREQQDRATREADAVRLAAAARDTLADADRREAELRRDRLLREDKDYLANERLVSINRAEAARLEAESARIQRERVERESKRSIADQAILDAHHARFMDLNVPRRFSSDSMFVAVGRLAETRELRAPLLTEHMRAPKPGVGGLSEVISSSTRRPLAVLEIEVGRQASIIRKTITDILELPTDVTLEQVMPGLDEEEKKFFSSIDNAVRAGVSAANELAAAEDELRRLAEEAAGASDAEALRTQLAQRAKDLDEANSSLTSIRDEVHIVVERAEAAEAALVAATEEAANLRKSLAGVIDDDFQVMLDRYGVNLEDRTRPGFYMLVGRHSRKLALVATFPAGSLPSGMIERDGLLSPLMDEVNFLFKAFEQRQSEISFHYVDPRLRSMIGNDNSGVLASQIDRTPEALLELLHDTVVDMGDKA